MTTPENPRLTLLAGGDTVYVYPDIRNNPEQAARLAIQQAMLDIAYPADETRTATVDAARWPEISRRLRGLGVSIVDTRLDETEAPNAQD